MKALVYIQSRDERSQVRPFLSKIVPNIVMVNSAEELLTELRSTTVFDILILDDSFDAKSPDGENLFAGASVPEILQEIQAGYTSSTDATILTILRPAANQEGHSTVSDFVDSSMQDREHLYTDLGASLFLAKPFNTDTFIKRMAELVRATGTPPVWIKALKQIRQLYNQKMYAEVLGFLDKLEQSAQAQNQLGFLLLRAKCLSQMEGEHIQASQTVLEGLRQNWPQSLSVRMLLLEGHLKLGQLREAFNAQLGIFETQKTSFNFDKALNLMCEIFDRAQEGLLIECVDSFMQVLAKDPPPFSRKLRPRIFECVAERAQEISSWSRLVELLLQSEDVIEATAPVLRKSLERLEPYISGPDKKLVSTFHSGHIMMLARFPSEPKSLEIASSNLLEKDDLLTLDQLLKRAQEAGANSLEYYLAQSQYFLKIDNLKDASDVLHKAVRIKADDIRVLELRQIWQQKYDARNKPPVA